MRVAAAILLLGLTSCRDKQADPKSVLACMSSQPRHDDYSLVTRCEPLRNSERIAGTWLVGFETSLFREARASRDNRLTDYRQLIVPAPISDAVHERNAMGYKTYDIVFVGRRSQLKPDPTTFVADRIISIRRVQMQPPR